MEHEQPNIATKSECVFFRECECPSDTDIGPCVLPCKKRTYDTEHQEKIVCPYCGVHASTKKEDWFVWDGDWEDEEICEVCGKPYTVEYHVHYSFTTDKQEK